MKALRTRLTYCFNIDIGSTYSTGYRGFAPLACIVIGLSCCIVDTVFAPQKVVKIGVLLESTDPELYDTLRIATDNVKSESSFGLEFIYRNVTAGNSHEAANTVCAMLKDGGVDVVIGPPSFLSSSRVQSICQWLHVPYITITEDFRMRKSAFSVNLAPHSRTLSKAYAALIGQWEWYDQFAVIYEVVEDLLRIQDMLQFSSKRVYIFQLNTTSDDRILLKYIKNRHLTRIVLAAQEIGMTTEYYDYVIPNLDVATINFEEYYNKRMNITGFQLIDPTQKHYKNLMGRLQRPDFNDTLQDAQELQLSIKTEVALLYDALLLYYHAVFELDFKNFTQQHNNSTSNCEDGQVYHLQNEVIIEKLKSSSFYGLTGLVKFDNDGLRTDFSLNIIKLMYVETPGFKKIATWSTNKGYVPHFTQEELQEASDKSLSNIKLKVVSVLNKPFFMEVPKDEQIPGGPKYEGFMVDLVAELAKRENFTYEIDLVADRRYGSTDKAGRWYGLIGALVYKEADLAAADLVITRKREEVVDFSTPFLHVGLTMLMKKPAKISQSYFSFLNPFGPTVWICMMTAYLGTSVLLFLVARLSPHEWINPHPCNKKPKELENKFCLKNSLWCTIGALMQQGSDLEPKATSTRMLSGFWWFFTLIMISSYTANLAAFLTAVQAASSINSVADLARQTDVKYGIIKGGATQDFFQKAHSDLYRKMYAFMESTEPSVFPRNNDEGVARVKLGNYAFFTESPFVEYLVARDCELMQVGGMLDSKGHGIAMPKNSPHWNKITSGILHLQEEGVLAKLKFRWWKKRGLGQACPAELPGSAKLSINQLGGVFLLLVIGMGIACLIGAIEFLWETRKKVPLKGSYGNELKKELKFAAGIFTSTKPVMKNEKNEDAVKQLCNVPSTSRSTQV